MGRHWLFSALALGGGACLGVYTYYVWRRRRASAGVSLAVALAAAGWWGLAYAIELAETRLPARLLWGDLKWLGVAVLPPAWFAFIMQFTGHGRWVNRRTMAALAVPPAAVLVLLAVPATHDLVRYYPASAAADPANAIAQVGWAFWPFLAYADAIFWSTTALFVWTLTRLSRLYWRQSLLLIATVLLPFLANILHNLNVGPFARVELTPFLFVLTGAVLVWGIFRFRLLDLAPIARGKIFELMHDAVVVLDPYGRVVDANLEAARLIGQPVTQAVGRPLEQLLPAFGNAVTPAWTASDLRRDEASMGGRDYELTISALPDQWGRPTGALLIARDVSERRRVERHVRESLAREQAATERLTVALEREQAATERLRALDEMKDAFLQAVSHDLRTPLTSVLGLTLTLRRGHQALPAAELGDLLGRLEGNARKLDRLLTNLLDLDRLARGALTLERRRVDLGELVGGIVKEAEAELLGERP
ncbi:MAG TPA: histidine kinase N-terminal 7TM domain-containing protein, partial [Actinomycetota bacterium]